MDESSSTGMGTKSSEFPVSVEQARSFIEQYITETGKPENGRIETVTRQIRETGTYAHTLAELTWGVRVAWRHSARCIGRLYWNSLQVRDRRHVHRPADVASECGDHLRSAWRGGRIRPTVSVFAPQDRLGCRVRIVNEQLIRYAGHRERDGTVTGDRRNTGLTDLAKKLGWVKEQHTPFDVLPLIIEDEKGNPQAFDLPVDAVHEVPLTHPDSPGFAALGLRWHAIPAIANMPLEVGGIRYSAAPFNGWYMGTEIGARNLVDADRYHALPAVAEALGINTGSERTLWQDRALIELNRAVLHSFDAAGVSITDHHTESRRFLQHVAKEARSGRECPVDWSWIVPPISAALTGVYHRYYDAPDPRRRPAFLPR